MTFEVNATQDGKHKSCHNSVNFTDVELTLGMLRAETQTQHIFQVLTDWTKRLPLTIGVNPVFLFAKYHMDYWMDLIKTFRKQLLSVHLKLLHLGVTTI